MAVGNGGWLTDGITVITGASITGNELVSVDTQLTGGQAPQTGAVSLASLGAGPAAITVVAAAGATQGNATMISGSARKIVITVTASTEGVQLPTASTGLALTIWGQPSVGCKVWPFTGDVIGSAATNAAYALVKNTTTSFLAINTTNWRVNKGT